MNEQCREYTNGLNLKSMLIGAKSVGVCYGMLGNNLPSHNDVIQLYKSKNIKRLRLYEPNHEVLEAL